MLSSFRKSATLVFMALTVALGAACAQAQTLPGLTNLDFSIYSGTAPKASFSSVNPTGWTANPTVGGIASTFIAHPCGSGCVPGSSQDQSAANPVYSPTTYANPTDLTPSVFTSALSNYVMANGNAATDSGFSTSLTNLTVGQTYELTFYQGASMLVGYSLPSNDQWIVSLGTSGLQVQAVGGGPCTNAVTCTYFNSDPHASTVASPLMNVSAENGAGWEQVMMYLTADSTSEKLSFLAWGNNGETYNVPPVLFLTGIDADLPEPSTWAMLIVGFLGIGGLALSPIPPCSACSAGRSQRLKLVANVS